MEVTFVNPGVDHMIQRIMAFQSEDASPFWSEPLYHFYPQLDKAYAVSLPFPERRNYIERCGLFMWSREIRSTKG